MSRSWPLDSGRVVTSPFGPRGGGFHAGVDFGFPGGSAGRPVYSIADSTVKYVGAAQGYGGPAPHGWIVTDSPNGESWEYGHITALPTIRVGTGLQAGQRIATINPDSQTNGGTAPHLHLSYMATGYNPARKTDPMPVLAGATEPAKEMTVGWTGDPIWLADVLRAQQPALKVKELPDWQQYGHGDMRELLGVVIHHTGSARADAMSIRNGRPDLEGPLSQLHISQDGTVTVVAAGVCWHAGMGSYPGIPTDAANYHTIGIECAWPRDTTITEATQTRERWPDAQIIAMRDTCAAILTRLGLGSDRVIAHKEWAPTRKFDPGNLSAPWFRQEVAKAQRGDFRPAVPKVVVPQYPRDWNDRQLLEAIWQDLQKAKA